VSDLQRDPPPSRRDRVKRALQPRRLLHLSLREYLPLLATVALWAVIVLAIGHADTARLFAATVTLRAIQMLTRLNTAKAVKLRTGASKAVMRQARRFARLMQLAVFAANVAMLFALVRALEAIGQAQVAHFLPLIAVGWPSRILRYSDVRTDSPYFRLALSAGGLALVSASWAIGLGATGVGLAVGMREWVAYAVIRYWPKAPRQVERPVTEPLRFAEIARNTAISGRRLLTYRMTKIALTIFGPVGNFAARTGRGLNWHNRIEPFLPHRLSGFILFSVVTTGGAMFLALRSGEPAAMVGAAGLMQLAAASANIAAMWKYLPDRAAVDTSLDEDDDD
jgi:hypothetical protein